MQFICQLDDPHFRKSHKSSSFALLPTEVSISFLLINSEEKFNVRDCLTGVAFQIFSRNE